MYSSVLLKRIINWTGIIFTLLVFIIALPMSTLAADKKIVRVGIFAFDGFYNTSVNGIRYGYGYDYLSEIAKHTNFEYEFVEGSWGELQVMLQNGEIDLLDSAQNTIARDKLYNFSEYSTGISYGALFALKSNTKIDYNDFEVFNSCKIGLLKDNSRNNDYLEYAKENNFQAENIEFSSTYQLNKALRDGTVDLIVTSNLRNVVDEKEVARFAPSSFFMITNKNNTRLMEEINIALKEIQTYKMYFNLSLYKKYYENSAAQRHFTRREKLFLATKPTFTMVYPADWSPFEYDYNDSDTNKNVNNEIIKLISETSGINFNLVRVDTYEHCLKMVRDGEADFLMYFDNNSEKAYSLGIKLSDVFISTPFVLIGKDANIPDGKVIALSKNYTNAAEYVQKMFSNNQLFIYDNQEACYDALLTGRADYIFENINVVGNLLKMDKYKMLSIVHSTSLMNSFAFAARKDLDPLVMEIINKSISSISSEQIENIIHTNSVSKKTALTLAQIFEEYRKEILVAIFFVVVIVLSILTYIIFMQKRTEKSLWKMAYVDELTGIYNLNKFKLKANNLLEKVQKEEYQIIRFDIKQFKLINDMFGFEEGNLLLLEIVKNILAVLPSDIIFARITADNFILLNKIKQSQDQHIILDVFESLKLHQKGNYSIDFSVGIYNIKPEDSDIAIMLERVNMAHKEAKQGDNNSIVFYNDEIRAKAIRIKDIENRMETALQNNEFTVFLQPKYRIVNKSIVGAEALVRWHTEQGTLIYPNDFIPIFEQNRFVLQLDMYVLRQVCILQKKFIDENITPVTISVNFSRHHLQNENFVEQIMEIVSEYNIPPALIEIELTENAVIGNQEILSDVLVKLHKVGITFSMDDFGTGYSSLGLLKNMRIDVIKIDKSFFDKCSDDTRAQTVVASIVAMANNLNIKTVAEGIETKENIDFLQSVSADIMVQGYYYARPMPAMDFEKLLIASRKD